MEDKIIGSEYYNNEGTKKLEPIMDLLFKKRFVMYEPKHESYNQFISKMIVDYLENGTFSIDEETEENRVIRHLITFSNITMHVPVEDTPEEPILIPHVARIKNLNYSSKLTAKVDQIVEILDIVTMKKSKKILYSDVIPIAKIPIMLRSAYCVTQPTIAPNIETNECKFNPGCSFIINGGEKVILSVEKMVENKIFVFIKKDITYEDSLIYTSQVYSKSNDINATLPQICSMKMQKDLTINMTVPHLAEIPIFILMRALGIETDEDIIKYIIYDINDIYMYNVIKHSMNIIYEEYVYESGNEKYYVKTKEQAIIYLLNKLRIYKKYSETDIEERKMQKRITLLNVLANDLLPHLGIGEDSLLKKAYYIGYMANRLISCYLGRIDPDDRDSYLNKRIDMPGQLLYKIFKQGMSVMINDCAKKFKKKRMGTVVPNVINNIQPGTIEVALNKALSTGVWGMSKYKGVAQVLQRLTYLQSITYFRRIITPSKDKDQSTAKIINMRYVDPHCYGYIDPMESPDGHKVGLVKGEALSAIITNEIDQDDIIMNVLNKLDIINFDINPLLYKKYTKIFYNGNWIGFTNTGHKMTTILREKRMKGIIHKYVSISYNRKLNEIHINSEAGRLIRPLLRVVDNKLVITEEIIKEINIGNEDIPGKINTLSELLTKYPDVIEYIDIEESNNILVAMFEKDLTKNKEKMEKTIESPSIKGNIVNRYEDTYMRYTHCEIHPVLQMGCASCNNVLSEHNAGPRNVFNYSQSRQAMGIYASDYKHRADISYILLHTQIPLVISRAARYTGTLDLPAGENAIVAIAPYTGYNQEDSIIINKTSVERGLFNSLVLKKYEDVSKKNSQTTAEDEFGIKDMKLVNGINEKEKNYSKVTDKGFPLEETKIVNNDIIIAKVSPVNDPNGKPYRDESTVYKSNTSATVEKVWSEIYDGDGFLMLKMRIRSLRVPMVGDKLCCYDPETEVLTNNGWKHFEKLEKTDKVATLIEGKVLQYIEPSELQTFEYKGPMYYIDTNQVNLLVTPNHRMYVADRQGIKYKVETAEEISGKRRKYMKNVEHNGNNGLSTFTIKGTDELPDLTVPINEWLIFFGIWIAEGCMLRDWGVTIATHKQRVKEALEKICPILEFPIHKHKDKKDDNVRNAWLFNDIRLVKYFTPLSVGATNKSLPEWTWSLNNEQCKILINGMLLGDGHTMENGTCRYDTSSTILADDFQRLCLHAGFSCNKMLKYEAGHESVKKDGTVIKSTANAYRLTVITSQNNPIVNKNMKTTGEDRQDQMIPYDGKVYCCTVPTNDGIIYVRRNGISVWSGNSRHGQKGTVGLTLRSEDMPISEHGIIPDLIINPCCFTGDTLVNLPNGLYKRIDEFSEQGLEPVITFDDEEKQFKQSFSIGMECKGKKDVVSVILMDGRTIKCTPDHKFKVLSEGKIIYKEAATLIKMNEQNADKILCTSECTEDKIDELEKDWFLEVNNYKFTMDNELNRYKSLAFARLLGFLHYDGYHKNKKNSNIELCPFMHNDLDTNEILNDIEILTGIRPTVLNDYKFYNIELPNKLKRIINKIMKSQNIGLPTIILDKSCPKSFIREYLGGYFGTNAISNNNIGKIKLSKFIDIKNDNITYEKFIKINELLNKLNVSSYCEKICCIMNEEVAKLNIDPSFIPSYMKNMDIYNIELNVPSNLQFQKYIGYRYNNYKSIQLSKASSYERYIRMSMNITDETFIISDSIYEKNKSLESKYLNMISNTDLINDPYGHNTLLFMPVLNIVPSGSELVYDIGVSKSHNFCVLGMSVSNCIPTRMTLGQLLESPISKIAALKGQVMEVTQFNEINIDNINKELVKYGFKEYGNEIMYCGMTGKKMETPIFIGPTYYLRLKHLVADKIHSRGNGIKQLLTRQPPEGRALNGGFRFGEMERDVMIAHGTALNLKERMMDVSDIYYTRVCNKCGLFATKSIGTNTYYCSLCSGNEISKIVIPYAFKLAVQELQAMSIFPKIYPDVDEFTSQK